MDIKRLSPRYAVSPQINPEDIAQIAAEGYGTILCNRPDMEIPPSHHADQMQLAVEAAGLVFVRNPVTHHGLNEDMITLQRETIDGSEKPTFAYCASGTRSTIVWALGQGYDVPADTLIEAAAENGYDISGLRGELDRRHNA